MGIMMSVNMNLTIPMAIGHGDERSGTLAAGYDFQRYNETTCARTEARDRAIPQSRRIGRTRWTQGESAVKLATFTEAVRTRIGVVENGRSSI